MGSYPSAEKQSVYSTAPADWAKYSIRVRIPSKESSEIISAIFKHWVAYFGTPGFILTDNGTEFNNQSFRDMAQNLNIVVRTTATEKSMEQWIE